MIFRDQIRKVTGVIFTPDASRVAPLQLHVSGTLRHNLRCSVHCHARSKRLSHSVGRFSTTGTSTRAVLRWHRSLPFPLRSDDKRPNGVCVTNLAIGAVGKGANGLNLHGVTRGLHSML